MLLRGRLFVAIALFVIALGSPRVRADSSFAISDRDPDRIRDLVASLTDSATALSDDPDTDVVTLARTLLLEFDRFDASRTENRVHRVHRGPTSLDGLELDVDPRFVRRVRGWVLRADGRFERTLEIGGPNADLAVDRSRSIAIDFDTLAPGDVFGWTATSDLPYGVEHHVEHLAQRWPTLRTRIHARNARHLSYRVESVNTDGAHVDVDIRERRDGHPTWHVVDAGPIQAHREAVFAPHAIVHEPYVRIVRRGRFYPALDAWVLQNDWDVWAALEMGSPTAWSDEGLEIRRLALELTSGRGTEADRADALYRWVVENVTLDRSPFPASVFENADRALNLDPLGLEDALGMNRGPSSFYGWRPPPEWDTNEITGDPHMGRHARPDVVRPVDEVIAAGRGSGLERAAVLASLIRAAGLEALIGFARDDRLGPVDLEATGRWQFTDAVVALRGADRVILRWYCPSRDALPPGALGRGLRGIRVLFVDPEIDEKMRTLWNEVWRAEGRLLERVVPRYLASMRREIWTRSLTTPRGEDLPVQRLVEVLRFGPRARTAAADVRMDTDFVSQAYWARRFPAAADSTTPLAADLALATGLPTGSPTWTIDPDAVYGEGPLQDWTSPRELPVSVDRTREYRWSVSLPVPDDWEGVAAVDPVTFDHDALQYRAWVVTGTSAVVLERQLVLRAGTVDGNSLRELDAVVQRILEHERTPIVLRAASGTR